MESQRIGSLAKATDTKVVTIRYYEKIGLLPEPPRTRSGYRVYDSRHRERLRFVRRCRNLGFTLSQVRQLLDLSVATDKNCAGVDKLALEHLRDIEEKIADLNRLAQQLRRLGKSCKGGTVGDCRIIEVLSASG